MIITGTGVRTPIDALFHSKSREGCHTDLASIRTAIVTLQYGEQKAAKRANLWGCERNCRGAPAGMNDDEHGDGGDGDECSPQVTTAMQHERQRTFEAGMLKSW